MGRGRNITIMNGKFILRFESDKEFNNNMITFENHINLYGIENMKIEDREKLVNELIKFSNVCIDQAHRINND